MYLGSVRQEALERYHRLALGQSVPEPASVTIPISAKALANRYIESQKANWREARTTERCYEDWLGRFLKDHPGLQAEQFTVEMFAAWKVSLRRRNYAPESINHYLSAVRAMYAFGEEAGIIEKVPRLRRIKNEIGLVPGSRSKPLYAAEQIQQLLDAADLQMQLMILLALNCGFGPKDVHDVEWNDVSGQRVTLPRSKTGICQSYRLWPETVAAVESVRSERRERVSRAAKKGRIRSDGGRIFITKYWRPWHRDAVAEQFRKLCKRAGVPCHGFYRLRHGASTAVSLVASPHVQRRFMRHAQLQQQVTYTHTPDAEVDAAVMEARFKLLGSVTANQESDRERTDVA
jgi:integrase